jgi:acylphosphatase
MVQGVGFRYTAASISRNFQVAGHVKNLPDGRVELLAQGQAEEVSAFLGELERSMAHHIDSVQCHDQKPQEDLTDFRVTY